MTLYLVFLLVSLTVLAQSWDMAWHALSTNAMGRQSQVVQLAQRSSDFEPNQDGAASFSLRTPEDWSALGISLQDLQILPLLMFAGVYVFVVFGFLSRRCERQADLFGCRAVSCARKDCADHAAGEELPAEGRGLCPTGIRIFINALEKVARLNGISRSRPGWMQSWQHSTIACRVEFLQQILADPTREPLFQRHVARVRWGLLLFLFAALGVLGIVQGRDEWMDWLRLF